LAVDKVLFARGDYTKSLMLLWLRILLDRRIAIPQYQVSNGGTPPLVFYFTFNSHESDR